jgi:hypothetical protein
MVMVVSFVNWERDTEHVFRALARWFTKPQCISGHHGKLEVPTHRSEHTAMTFDRVRHPRAPLERSQESESPRDWDARGA